MEDEKIRVRNAAGNYFREGYNCAEAIFLTFKDHAGLDLGEDAIRLMTGFGSGVGQSGCMCGALTAAVACLNMFTGRNSNRESRDSAYEHANRLHNLFKEKFGNTCCRILNPYKYETPEHLKTCLKITGNTAKLLMEYLEDNELSEEVAACRN